jgi:hypothetical protein
MRIVDLELKRYDIKIAEVETKKNDVELKRKSVPPSFPTTLPSLLLLFCL